MTSTPNENVKEIVSFSVCCSLQRYEKWSTTSVVCSRMKLVRHHWHVILYVFKIADPCQFHIHIEWMQGQSIGSYTIVPLVFGRTSSML